MIAVAVVTRNQTEHYNTDKGNELHKYSLVNCFKHSARQFLHGLNAKTPRREDALGEAHRSVNCGMKFYAVVFFLILISCNEPNKDPGSETVHTKGDTIARSSIAFIPGCYEMTNNGDTTIMQLQVKDSTVSGTVISKKGKVKIVSDTLSWYGVIRDTLLHGVLSKGIGAYGTSSVFLARNDSLIPEKTLGTRGPEQKGTSHFKIESAYVRVNCKE